MKSSSLVGLKLAKNPSKFKEVIQRQYSEAKGRPTPELDPLFVEFKTDHYYITEKVVLDCKKIELDDPFDLTWIENKLNNRVYQWSFKKEMIRFIKYEGNLLVIHMWETSNISKDDEKMIGFDYSVFDFDIANKTSSGWVASEKISRMEESKRLFYQLLTFIYLAPVELIVVEPKQKHGTKKNSAQLLNEEDFKFTIINITWNKLVARMTPFMVEGKEGYGFYRKQACGPQWKDRKLIWIEPYEKKQYVRAEAKRLKGIE